MRRGSALCITTRDRLSYVGNELSGSKEGAQQAARYVLATSYRAQTPPVGYRALAEGEILSVDLDLQLTSHSVTGR